MDAFEIAQAAQRPSLAYGFTIQGLPVDLTGAGSAAFFMRRFDGTAPTISGTAALTVPLTSGSVTYAWGTADTTTVGDYRGRFTVYFPSGGPLESPEFPIRIYAYQPDRSVPGVAVEMGPIIRRVRRLLDDSPGPTQTYDDTEIDEVLQRRSTPVYDLPILGVPQRVNGTVEWHDYYLTGAYIGGTAFTVKNTAGSAIASGSYSFNENQGLIRFPANTLGSAFLVTGTKYEIGNAAADCLQRILSRMAAAYDVTMDGQTFNRSQVYKAMQDRIGELRGADSETGGVETVRMKRTDMPASGHGGGRIFDQTDVFGKKVYEGGRYIPQPPGGSYPA